MSIIDSKNSSPEAAIQIANLMIAAAKTAPKGKGIETLEYLIITETDLQVLSKKMNEISARDNISFLSRDATNILQSELVVIIGNSTEPKNVPNCNNCGFGCANKPETTPCAVGTVDLGIAIGSAVDTAMLHKADNRIMYSAGIAVLELGWFTKKVKHAYGIPISLTEKSPFFDRK
mgnify:CR=1 FL=1